MTIVKPNFPENTLVYINNNSNTPVKGGHALYLEYVIIGQILLMANLPPGIDLDKDDYKDNEVLIFNPENGLYRGLTKKFGYVTLRVDLNENFYAMVLTNRIQKFCFALSDNHYPIFFSVQLSKNLSFLMSENQENLKFSKMIEKRKLNSIMGMLIYMQLM